MKTQHGRIRLAAALSAAAVAAGLFAAPTPASAQPLCGETGACYSSVTVTAPNMDEAMRRAIAQLEAILMRQVELTSIYQQDSARWKATGRGI